jgi:hypothetical protein
MKIMKKELTIKIIILDFSNLNKNSRCSNKFLKNHLYLIKNIIKLILIKNLTLKMITSTFIPMKIKIMKRDNFKNIRIICINRIKEIIIIKNLKIWNKRNTNRLKKINSLTKKKNINSRCKIHKKILNNQ